MRLPGFLLPLRWFYQAHIWGFGMRLRNIRLFADAVWHFDTCDYAPLLRLIHVATKEMARLYKEHGMVVGSERTARQLTVVAELCRRLEADDHFTQAGYKHETWPALSDFERKRISDHAEYMVKQDVEYLAKTMKDIRCWWQ